MKKLIILLAILYGCKQEEQPILTTAKLSTISDSAQVIINTYVNSGYNVTYINDSCVNKEWYSSYSYTTNMAIGDTIRIKAHGTGNYFGEKASIQILKDSIIIYADWDFNSIEYTFKLQ